MQRAGERFEAELRGRLAATKLQDVHPVDEREQHITSLAREAARFVLRLNPSRVRVERVAEVSVASHVRSSAACSRSRTSAGTSVAPSPPLTRGPSANWGAVSWACRASARARRRRRAFGAQKRSCGHRLRGRSRLRQGRGDGRQAPARQRARPRSARQGRDGQTEGDPDGQSRDRPQV